MITQLQLVSAALASYARTQADLCICYLSFNEGDNVYPLPITKHKTIFAINVTFDTQNISI